ncbi:DUF1554 domain-containing protein, partial [bacterium]|nr:DUF1554 domain-containing protein [bacterium]
MLLQNRGQTSVLLALGLSVALLGTTIGVSKIVERKNRQAATENVGDLNGFYSMETVAWHARVLSETGALSSGTRASTSMSTEMAPSLYASDTYQPGSYVAGQPIDVAATQAFDSARLTISQRASRNPEHWMAGSLPSYCGSVENTQSGRWVRCLATVAPAPVVTFTALTPTINSGQQPSFSWTAQNVTSCTIKKGATTLAGLSPPPLGPWQGPIETNTGASALQVTYTLACTGSGGDASRDAIVTVQGAPPISVTLRVTGFKASLMGSCAGTANLVWNSNNASTCTITYADGSPFAANQSPNGSAPTGHQFGNVGFIATCYNGTRSGSASVSLPTYDPFGSAQILFTTREAYQGNLGGLAGADAICKNSARAAKLRPNSNWRALLGDGVTSARSRITIRGPVRMVSYCGIQMTTTAAQFWSATCQQGPPAIWYPSPNVSEYFDGLNNSYHGANKHGAHTWSGICSADGTCKSGNNCKNWTNSTSSYSGDVGDGNDSQWDDRYQDATDGC